MSLSLYSAKFGDAGEERAATDGCVHGSETSVGQMHRDGSRGFCRCWFCIHVQYLVSDVAGCG